MFFRKALASAVLLEFLPHFVSASPISDGYTSPCKQTQVLVLGAGITGITAAKTLTNESITDFLIIEYNDKVGGRVLHTDFGNKSDGTPYVVELGANWVQGIKSPGGPVNPIWTLAKRANLTNTYSNYSDILTYDHTGAVDFSHLFDVYDNAYNTMEEAAGYILTDNLLDHSVEAGMALAGWNPRKDKHKEAVDWWEWDWEYAATPSATSELFGVVNYNTTFYQYSDANNFVFDQRGYSTFITDLASTYLKPDDPRLLLNTPVTNISYTSDSVTVHTKNGTCYTAPHAIMTFSVGVLQAVAAGAIPLSFSPPLPHWKQSIIASFYMGTYTKIFLQFDPADQFWPEDTQYFLYASPTTRGYYPLWQSLTAPGFIRESGIIFVTVVGDESARIEAQSDDETKAEVLAVLRQMYGADKVPEPKAFMYPRWGKTEWAFGSYSNWPTGVTLQQHQNLRANVEGLWFAGEATSTEYFGFLQGAYFEGMYAGVNVAKCLKGGPCPGETHYTTLPGTGNLSAYGMQNGWDVSSFLDYGF